MIPLIIQTTDPKVIFQYVPFARKENNPDIIEINKDGEGITIEVVRELQQILIERPYYEDHRVVIIYGVETANAVTQNALLKSLEEPPEFIQFILQTPTPSILLPTLRSRCKIIDEEKQTTQLPHSSSTAIQPTTIPAVIELSDKIKTRQDAQSHITQLLEQLQIEVEKTPTLKLIEKISHAQQAHLMLQSNTNIKLVMDWLGFKLLT